MVSESRSKFLGSLKLNSVVFELAPDDVVGVAGGVSGAGVVTGGGGGGMTNIGGGVDAVGFFSGFVILSLSNVGMTLVTTLLDGMAPGIHLKQRNKYLINLVENSKLINSK